jgi:arylsulfate sulfotransferase
MLLKDSCSNSSPAIMDTDGALRWVGTAGVSTSSSAFFDNAIYIAPGTQLLRNELDGTVSLVRDYSGIGVIDFHHNIDRGKSGLLVEVDTTTDIESVILEVDKAGQVRKTWNMALIIANAMRAAGDDPSGFVRRGEDWFHNNAATYRRSDDSLIVSSRENFVIALDYQSGAIKWILGDQTKAWYQYPSLRQYALTVPAGGVAPIGQHAVSITYNDKLLLFDNGFPSFNQTPPGSKRTFAAPRKYALNLNTRVAQQIFSDQRPIISEICSSVYEDAPNNYLVDYAVAGGYQSGASFAEILGLQANGKRAFDYKYPTTFCDEIFNAFPIHLEQLSF